MHDIGHVSYMFGALHGSEASRKMWATRSLDSLNDSESSDGEAESMKGRQYTSPERRKLNVRVHAHTRYLL